MDYQRIYDQFIADRLNKCGLKRAAKGREIHHIRPRGGGLGGTDEPYNLISLTPGDHLFAHRLLAKIHGGPMASAFFLMLNNPRYQGRRSRGAYARQRQQIIDLVGARNRGKPQHPNLAAAIARYNATRKLPKGAPPTPALPTVPAWQLPRTAAQLAALEKGRRLPHSKAQLAALAEGRRLPRSEAQLRAFEKTSRRPRSPAQLASLAKGRAAGCVAAAEKRRKVKT